MENFFNHTDILTECELKLNNYLYDKHDFSFRLGALPITIDDLKFLTFEFIKLKQGFTTVTYFDTIPLCVIVFMTFALKYKDVYSDSINFIKSFNMPQHYRRMYVETMANTISEYNLETFNFDYTSYDGLKKLLYTYAGL